MCVGVGVGAGGDGSQPLTSCRLPHMTCLRARMQLRADVVPLTAENFRALCTGACPPCASRRAHLVPRVVGSSAAHADNRTSAAHVAIVANTLTCSRPPAVVRVTAGEKGFGYKGSAFHRVIPNFSTFCHGDACIRVCIRAVRSRAACRCLPQCARAVTSPAATALVASPSTATSSRTRTSP